MRTYVRVRLDRLAANYRAVQNACPPKTTVIAVVKADAYGHGAVPVARRLNAEGCRRFAVAGVEEAAELRAAGVEGGVLLLSGTLPGEEREAARLDCAPMLHSVESFERWRAVARRLGRRLPCQIKIDSGMNRLGFRAEEDFAGLIQSAPELDVQGVGTHLAAPEDFADPLTERQLQRFRTAVERLRAAGFTNLETHFAGSAALAYRDLAGSSAARVGLGLYGFVSLPRGAAPAPRTRLLPVLEWRARVVAARRVPAGERVGYNGAFQAPRDTRIALLAVGYGDGFRRELAGGGEALLAGARRAIVGKISMDLAAVDVTDAPEIREGDEAVLLGDEITLHEMAANCSTTAYEILCGLSPRVRRVFDP